MKRLLTCFLIIFVILSFSSCSLFQRSDTKGYAERDVKLIAHRGLSGLEIENTASAFIAAGKRSYYGIEADVRKTADGKFVICHDDTLERVAGESVEVETSTLEKLLEVKLLDRNGKEKTDERLATLEEFISICKEYGKAAILELKSSFCDEEIAAIIDIIEELEYIESVTFISFSYSNLLAVRKILPEQKVQYLFSEVTDEVIEMLINDGIDASIGFTSLRRRDVKRLHEAGLEVGCWTLDYRILAGYAALIGVDYITTNILE